MNHLIDCNIFCNLKLEKPAETIYFTKYKPYRVCGAKNPDFDRNSGLILDLKEGKEFAINWAFNMINPYLGKSFAITVVPSHDSLKMESPIKTLARRLVQAEPSRIDATGCLVRHTTIPKLAYGGDRSIDTHLKSIKVINPQIIQGIPVLVIDDVRTTGNSLSACVQLVKNFGAYIVKALAVSQTEGY